MSKKAKINIKTALDNLDQAAMIAARALKKFAWAYIRVKYHFTRDFSDN